MENGYYTIKIQDCKFPLKDVNNISRNRSFELTVTAKLSEYHCKNTRWSVSLKTDYIQSGTLKFRRFRVVKGNKIPKDWNPAPEDVQQEIDNLKKEIEELKKLIK